MPHYGAAAVDDSLMVLGTPGHAVGCRLADACGASVHQRGFWTGGIHKGRKGPDSLTKSVRDQLPKYKVINKPKPELQLLV